MGPNYNLSLDPETGMLSIQPTPGGPMVAVLSIFTYEWRNGVVINTYQREMMVTAINCPGNTPPAFAGISNLSGGSSNGNDVYVCGVGTPLCFDIATQDPDTNQSLKLFWDGRPAGASFVDDNNASVVDTILGTSAAPPTGRFCWTPSQAGIFTLRLRVEDDYCPIFEHRDIVIRIHVGVGNSSASASLGTCPDVDFAATACGSGPFTFTWTGAGGLSSSSQFFSHSYPTAGSYPWQVIISNGGSVNDTIQDTVIVGEPQFNPGLLSGINFTAPCAGISHDTIQGPAGFSSYLWSTGATSQDLRVFFGGNYGLTVTAANGCQSYDSTELYWAEPYIYGIVNTSLGAPLMNQKIMLIKHDTATNYLYRLDSTYTDSAGYYFFCTTWDTVMYIKALPNIFAYPLEMPTYADSTLFWYNAIPFYGLNQVPFRHDFATISGINPGGLGFIGGYISQGANKTSGVGDPIAGLTIFLLDRNSGNVIGQRITNPFGYFSFSNLPAGDYEFKVDVPDMYNPNAPTLTLGAGQMHYDSLDFRLHSSYLELVMPTVGIVESPGFQFNASPNPFEGSTQLLLSLAERQVLSLELMDVQGRTVQSFGKMELPKGENRLEVGARLPSGIYFAKLSLPNGEKVLKLAKTK
jgi:PKD repeat protein